MSKFGTYLIYDGPFFSARADAISVRRHRVRLLCGPCARSYANDGVPMLLDDQDPVQPGDDCSNCGAIFGEPRLTVVP